MTVDDILLLHYADATLSADQAAELERMARHYPKLAEQLASLRASKHDYREAFAAQALAPIPTHLAETVVAMSQQALAANGERKLSRPDPQRDARRDAPIASEKRSVPSNPAWPSFAHWMTRWPGWIATFCTGALCYALVLHLVGSEQLLGRMHEPIPTAPTALASETSSTPPWIKAAAGYQQLFSRETLVDSQMTPAAETKLVNAIREQDRLALRVPDLSASGLDLKAVLRLRYHGEPLIQIVYLPETGTPIALCVMKDIKPTDGNQAASERLKVENMDVVTWRNAGLQYALIAAPGRDDLEALAKDVRYRPDT